MHEPYWCHKHRRTCKPTDEARQFLTPLHGSTRRGASPRSQALRQDVDAVVHHGDARTLEYGGVLDGLVTSPPYPGRIDYHGQHRYAFALLGLADRGCQEEIGAPARGLSRAASPRTSTTSPQVLANARRQLRPGRAGGDRDRRQPRHLYDACWRAPGWSWSSIACAT